MVNRSVNGEIPNPEFVSDLWIDESVMRTASRRKGRRVRNCKREKTGDQPSTGHPSRLR
jgi:hypothetical protein